MKYLVVAAAVAGSLLFAGAASATVNLVMNGSFENFNDGYPPLAIRAWRDRLQNAATSASNHTITTDYSYRIPNGQNGNGQTDSMYDEGTWTIGTNPNAVHDLWILMPLNSDPFLMLNGATANSNPPKTAWESQVDQSVFLGVGLYTYDFHSYDLLNLCCKANSGDATYRDVVVPAAVVFRARQQHPDRYRARPSTPRRGRSIGITSIG